jgi:hypothetical protein
MSEFQASNFKKENGGTPDFLGKTELTSPYFFVPPSGDTASRPQSCAAGTLRFNTDIGTLEIYRGDTIGWEQIQRRSGQYLGGHAGGSAGQADTSNSVSGSGTRAVFSGGYLTVPTHSGQCFNNCDVITIPTTGNSHDFGDLTASLEGGGNLGDSTRAVYAGGTGPSTPGGSDTNQIQSVTFASGGAYTDSGGNLSDSVQCTGLSDKTRGIFTGFIRPYNDTIEYVTIQALGNAVDFGNLTATRGYVGACASSTRGIIFGGLNNPSNPSINSIDFITISTTGDGTDFGDITGAGSGGRYEMAAFSNATRGLTAGGYGPNYTDNIEFVTIATKGNTTDFGDLLAESVGTGRGGAASKTRGIIAGGYGPSSPNGTNTIQFIEIATTGNALDFGDFENFTRRIKQGGCSNGHGGL